VAGGPKIIQGLIRLEARLAELNLNGTALGPERLLGECLSHFTTMQPIGSGPLVVDCGQIRR
jgi:hypothetical protein